MLRNVFGCSVRMGNKNRIRRAETTCSLLIYIFLFGDNLHILATAVYFGLKRLLSFCGLKNVEITRWNMRIYSKATQ